MCGRVKLEGDFSQLKVRFGIPDDYPAAARAAIGTLQTAGITLAWQARWADPANPDAAPPATLAPGGRP